MNQNIRDRVDKYLSSHTGSIRTSDFQAAGLHNSYLKELVQEGVLGLNKVTVEGNEIAMYDREKAICDSIRYRRLLGQDIVNEAIRKYLGSRHTNSDRIIEYSRVLKSERSILNHLRLLS